MRRQLKYAQYASIKACIRRTSPPHHASRRAFPAFAAGADRPTASSMNSHGSHSSAPATLRIVSGSKRSRQVHRVCERPSFAHHSRSFQMRSVTPLAAASSSHVASRPRPTHRTAPSALSSRSARAIVGRLTAGSARSRSAYRNSLGSRSTTSRIMFRFAPRLAVVDPTRSSNS